MDAGLGRHWLSNLEQEKGNPSLDKLERLAAALDVPLHQLFVPPPEGAPEPKTLQSGRKPL